MYLICYKLSQASAALRAAEFLSQAYTLLQEQAARIDDEGLRRSFLENVASHREIMSEFANAIQP